ncbi:MAG: 4-alpha-glucanotransferase, partial [Bacteroidales bacterium]|nr:4-alpha-glucanotransferase [Bacteroidales bacterium]
ARQILEQALSALSMLCILPLQDWLAVSERLRNPDVKAERINDPANPKHYWRYRMHIPIEKMAADTDFCQTVRELVLHSGRKFSEVH